jgi:hypothetical protein
MAKQREYGLFGRLIAKALNVPEEEVEQALATMRDNMQPKPNQPITEEQLIGMWLDEKGSISLGEQIALGFAYDKLNVYLQTKED